MSVHGKRAKTEVYSSTVQVTLKVDNDPRTVQAKKSQLIAASKYFETMFNSAFNERNSETISLGGGVLSFKVLDILVVFMESNCKILKPTEATIEQLFVAADYLQITSALRVLTDFLFADLGSRRLEDIRRGTIHMLLRLIDILTRYVSTSGYTYSTRTVLYNTGTSRGAPIKCTNEAILYLAYHFKTIMFDHGLLKLEYNLFERIVNSDFLRLSEEDVVRIIKIWINHDFEQRKKHFRTLIKCVRFDETMTVDFIMEEILDFVDCSVAKDYVISIFAKRLGYSKGITDIGPSIPKVRNHRRWDHKEPKNVASSNNTSATSVKDESVVSSG